MRNRKMGFIVVLLVAMIATAGLVQVAYADAAGDKDAVKKTFETKEYGGKFDLFNGKRQSWALLGASSQPTTQSAKGHGSLGEQATDPTSPLIQFRLQNSFIPESFDSTGYSNAFEIQPVIPWKAPWGQPMITRPTIPIVLTADPDGPINETSGLGDIDLLHVFIFKKDWGKMGLGFNTVFPSATDERLGSGKWQAGPAAIVIYTKIPKWQFGALVYNNWDYATQWICNYHYKPGWYVGVGDLPWTFNWRNGKQNMPLSIKWGHTTKIGKQPVDMFVQPFYTTAHDGASSEWGVKFNIAFLFPE
jgi:hypothetical protein